ncbi:DUF4011 domain-containing protein [bacterium]|nr:DUF4011 domain-containing protein [bacterium]
MANSDNRVLDALLERLYAALARGPALNALPGISRQRLDLATLDRIEGNAQTVLADLLGEAKSHRIRFTTAAPPKIAKEDETPESKRLQREYDDGRKLLTKLGNIAREADMHQRDTGSASLFIGYPILSLPEAAARGNFGKTRLVAPLAFIPITLEVATGNRPGVTISSASTGADRVIANVALKTWIERQVGTKYPELFEDEEGSDPLREVTELMAHVAAALAIESVPAIDQWQVESLPDAKSLPEAPMLLPGAVLGLFPISKQGAIRDLEELKASEELPAVVKPFVTLDSSLTAASDAAYAVEDEAAVRLLPAAEEHLVDWADPCQRRAVIRARATRGLVVHGPPGTGKSQTITNIIGDYLARGKKVLLVCEKRTALDVVKYRLDARGLGSLCAVVHDATRDRTTLFTGVREQLDGLADAPALPDPTRDMERTNREIDTVTAELQEFYARLAEADPDTGKDFHSLAGLWLATAGETALAPIELDPDLASVNPETLRDQEGVLRSAYQRLIDCNLADNAWDGNSALSLDAFLAHRMDDLRRGMDGCVELARKARAESTPELPPLALTVSIADQAACRREMGETLQSLGTDAPTAIRTSVARMSDDALREAATSLDALTPQRELVTSAPLAADLQQTFNVAPWPPQQVALAIPVLATYLAKVNGFLGFFQFGAKKAAGAVLAPLGLPLDRDNVQKAKTFLEGVHARTILRGWLTERLPADWAPEKLDAALLRSLDLMGTCVALRRRAASDPTATGLAPTVREALQGDTAAIGGRLCQSAECANTILKLNAAMGSTSLFSDKMLAALVGKLSYGKPIDEDVAKLRDDLERMEHLLRFQEELRPFPPAVGNALKQLARTDAEPDAAWCRLLAATFAGSLQRRIASAPILLRCDATRIEGHFQRLRELTAMKMALEAARIQFDWRKRQRERLLASTGSRLSSSGADLRRRLALRGKQAARIRQVVHDGRDLGGGDPLFDIHPVWMSSPETASLIFPSAKLFDVVIFDEASQCRLEEGLPVLLRGENIVIAGDTKQLPPTRFFESAIIASDGGDSDDSGQEGLFQSQQSDIEDLLSAALNIEIEQSYLDVHYRSSNEDLIRFSNESFYGARLQAIPAHPNARSSSPPITLTQVDGVYEERRNDQEAEHVVARVRTILSEANPPSIGIVTFNLTQRDLIEEKLEREADKDPEFRAALDNARRRERRGGYEGLFVKNLENVQGDERDVILLSTTYGRTADGKFYRRLGPLGRAGGERRLNVIVTRARLRVEIATSIPPAIYRADANVAVPAGQKPNGAWFLMRYLRDAEMLADLYAKAAEERAESADPEHVSAPTILSQETDSPSNFAAAFARILAAEHGVSSYLYLGNDGFQVDLAFRHPTRPDDVTIGILFDSTRYSRAQDRVEWDGFKRMILESQRWELHRIWTPQFLRDPAGVVRQIIAAAAAHVERDEWGKERVPAEEE